MAKTAAATQPTVTARDMVSDAPSRGRWGTYLKLPSGVTYFKPTQDTDRIMKLIFLPWKPGKNHPRRETASWVVNFFFQTHPYLGPNSKDFACSLGVWGKPCAVCDHFQDLREKLPRTKESWKIIKEFKPKDGELFLLHDLDGPKNNIQVWDESVYLFGDFFRERVQMKAEYANYADFALGQTVLVKGREKQLENTTFIEYASVDFEKRPFEKMPDWMLKACQTLQPDEWVYETEYTKMKKMVLRSGGPGPEDNGGPAEIVVDETPPKEPFTEDGFKQPAATEEVVDEEPVVEEEEPEPEDDNVPFDVRTEVTFTFKGEKLEGVVKSTNGTDRTAEITSGKKTYKVKWENVTPKEAAVEEEVTEEVLEEEEAPPPKKGKK